MLSETLSALIKKADKIGEEIEDLEEILKQRKEDRNRILEEDIPTVLHENGLASAPLLDGRTVVVESIINVSQQNKDALSAWLIRHDYDAVIKTSFEFPKGSDTSEIEAILQREGTDYTKENFVHPMTLKKVIKDHLAAGGEYPPEEAAKASIFERAKIKETKA